MSEYLDKLHCNLRAIIPKPLRNPYISLAFITGTIVAASGITHLDNRAHEEYQKAKAQYERGEINTEPNPLDYNPVNKAIDKISEKIFT